MFVVDLRRSNGEKEGIATWAKERARMTKMKGTMTRVASPFEGGDAIEGGALDALERIPVPLVLAVGDRGEGGDEMRDSVGEEGEEVEDMVADGRKDFFDDDMAAEECVVCERRKGCRTNINASGQSMGTKLGTIFLRVTYICLLTYFWWRKMKPCNMVYHQQTTKRFTLEVI